MNLNREQLLRELEIVLPGLSTREIMEQSSCFIFKAGKVISYNDEIACSQKTSLTIEGAIQALPLISILRKMQDDMIEVEVQDGELLIKGKKRKAGIKMEEEILLPIESIEPAESWDKLHPDFTEAVSIVRDCAGKDETQFCITCIHIHPNWVETCDNYQLARYTIKTGLTKAILVRRDSLNHIISLGMIKFSETKNWIHFKNSEGLILSCRRFTEEYPDLTKLLKVEGENIVLPKGLKEAIERAEVFSVENTEDNHILIDIQKGKLKLKGVGTSGWFVEYKKIKYDGQPMSFFIAPQLLIKLTSHHNKCIISKNSLMVDGGVFKYVTCLGIVKKKEK